MVIVLAGGGLSNVKGPGGASGGLVTVRVMVPVCGRVISALVRLAVLWTSVPDRIPVLTVTGRVTVMVCPASMVRSPIRTGRSAPA